MRAVKPIRQGRGKGSPVRGVVRGRRIVIISDGRFVRAAGPVRSASAEGEPTSIR
jgi:hypothetical protein